MTQRIDVKRYSELIKRKTFEDKVKYLDLNGVVGEDTFGFDRYLNQRFYKSAEWRKLRNEVIIRDNGCDLGDPDHPINGKVLIHHMNPINVEDIVNQTEFLMNPEFLVCVSTNTHNAIHYGDVNRLDKGLVERSPNDTCPWRH